MNSQLSEPTLFDNLPKRARKAPSLGNQHHEGVDPVLDKPRLNTQYGIILNHMLDKNWHNQYAMARELNIPQGSIGSQIRNARVAGWLIEKRRRNGGGTWEYRIVGRR